MAKMKISELATEINVDKNEIVAFLQSTGFDCKSATKSIEDDQINAVRAKFAAKAEPKQEKAEPKKEAPSKPAEEAKAPKQEKKMDEAPKKKKVIGFARLE